MLYIIVGRLPGDGGVGGREVTEEVLDIVRCGHDARRKGEIYIEISWCFVLKLHQCVLKSMSDGKSYIVNLWYNKLTM